MATVTLPTQGQAPWDGTLNTAIMAINDEVENHEERIEVLEAGGGGGGAVDSVNGQTGVVVLDADDVGARSAGDVPWAEVSGKPTTFAPTIGATSTTAVAGNDARLTDQRTPSDNSVTSAKIVDGAIVNADINASAAIAQSKIANLTSDLGLKAPLASPAFTGTPTGITKAHVGLGNVDNTSDASKPISTLTQTALNAKVGSPNSTVTGLAWYADESSLPNPGAAGVIYFVDAEA